MNVQHWRNDNEKTVAVSLCPPQIPHGLGQDWTPVSALTGQRLINWVQK